MSEYQYYRFECSDGFLNSKQRDALREISSRAEITATSFQVFYHYSDLKADPEDVMLNHFDTGFYYANRGSIDTYIKLPAGTIPDALLGFETHGFYVYQTQEWQLLTFSIEEYCEYFDDEDAEGFAQHLTGLRNDLIRGDWRLLYLMWLRGSEADNELDVIPLIEFDFYHLSDALRAFAALYDISPTWIKALALTLSAEPHHKVKQTPLQPEDWLNSLTETDKNNLLITLFEQGQLTRHQALAMTTEKSADKEEDYRYWLTPSTLEPYIHQAHIQWQQEQAAALATQQAIEAAEKEKALIDMYNQREHGWHEAQAHADRTCASGYDQASRFLHQLFDAYQLKGDTHTFEQRFKQFIATNHKRKALLDRLTDLIR
ncbi:MAG: hypothetical protein OIF55_15695 [Amphritea sp.]|nr:hypothetical protein [Amphritea sp.]